MTNVVKILKATHNTISVQWEVQCLYNNTTIQSQPFALISDSYPLSFYFSAYTSSGMSVKIYSSSPGRAIVKLTGDRDSQANTKMAFIQCWKDFINFNAVVSLVSKTSTVKINCDITWLGRDNDAETKLDYLSGPLSDLNISFDNEVNPDFHIVIDDKKLPAHKLILARHSEGLATMFERPDWKESADNAIPMKGIELSTMETVLKIIYTGNTDDLDEIDKAIDVLQAAEQWQMPFVKSACERKLQLKIQDDNVVALLEEADKHNASELCHTCVQYIVARNDKILPRDKLEEMADEKPIVKAAVYKIMCNLSRVLTFETIPQ